MPLLNRILGALRGAAAPGRPPHAGGAPGGHAPRPAGGGVPRTGRGLLGALLGGRGRRRGL